MHLRRLLGSRRHKEMVSVALSPRGMAAAVVNQQQRQLQDLQVVACQAQEYESALREVVQQQGWQHRPCNLILSRQDYHFLQLESPGVPENEMTEALRWQLRDLVDFDVTEAVLDYVEVPQRAESTAASQVYVAAVPRSRLQAQVRLLQEIKLKPQVVDVPELALRNILQQLPQNEHGVALLVLRQTMGWMLICRQGHLLLARRLNTGLQSFGQAADEQTGDEELTWQQQSLLESVVLELQRSLDFYESNLARQNLGTLLVAPLEKPLPSMVDYLGSNLTPRVESLDVTQVVSGSEQWPQTQLAQGLFAIGAALRQEPA